MQSSFPQHRSPAARPLGRDLLTCLLSVLVPVLIMTAWHLQDRSYPRGDDGWYFNFTQRIYRSFKTEGFLSGLHSIYYVRPHQKPILVPELALPFASVFGGRAIPSIAATDVVLFAFLLAHVFLIALEFVPALSAAAITAAAGTTPWLFQNTYGFNAELPFLAFVAAAIYRLIRSELFTNRRQSVLFGVFLGLAFCTRPIECSLFFFPMLAVVVGWSIQRANITCTEWISSALLLAVGVACLTQSVRFGADLPDEVARRSVAEIAAAILAYLGVAWVAKRNLSGFTLAFAIAFGLPVLWFLPKMHSLFTWAYTNSFDTSSAELVQTGGRLDPVTGAWKIRPLTFFLSSFRYLGASFLPCAVIALFLGGFGFLKQNVFVRSKATLLACLSLLVLLPITIGSFSYNTDTRYFYASGLVLLLCLGWFVAKTKPVLLLMPLALHLYFAISDSFPSILPLPHPVLSEAFELKQPFSASPPVIHPFDSAEVLSTQVKEAVGNSGREWVGIASLGGDVDIGWILNIWVFDVLDSELGLNLQFMTFEAQSGESRQGYVERMIGQLSKPGPQHSFRYVLVGQTLYGMLEDAGYFKRGLEPLRRIETEDYNGAPRAHWLLKIRDSNQVSP